LSVLVPVPWRTNPSYKSRNTSCFAALQSAYSVVISLLPATDGSHVKTKLGARRLPVKGGDSDLEPAALRYRPRVAHLLGDGENTVADLRAVEQSTALFFWA